MLSNRIGIVLVTALAPIIWGTTYLVTTELLPPDRPLLAAVVRALPAGLLLVVLTRGLPQGIWRWRALVLGTLNIGAFFALLFVAAYRLPGGVAAIIIAAQPLLVAGLAAGLLGERLTLRTTIAAAAGVAGVSLLVLQADARLDGLGVAAAVGGAVVMATGVVLSKRWPSPAPLLTTTGWQLAAGGLLLLPVALFVEGPPPVTLSSANLAGYGYLTIVGAALAYALWFRGSGPCPRPASPSSACSAPWSPPHSAGWFSTKNSPQYRPWAGSSSSPPSSQHRRRTLTARDHVHTSAIAQPPQRRPRTASAVIGAALHETS